VNASTSAKPYVEVNSVNVVNTINGMRPYSQNKGYNEFLILNVTVVNPQGSGYEFPLNEETLRIETENYRFDYCSNMTDLRLENHLDGNIHQGETQSGELLYEVRDGLDYMYVRLIPDGIDLGVYELQNISCQPENALITAPYIEVKSVKIVGKINGMTPFSQNKGYDEFLVLEVTVVNPEGSGYEFPLNEDTLRIETENNRFDYCSNMNDIMLENPLKNYIREGESISGELLYEVRDGLDYTYVRLIPDGMNLGVYELQNISYQPENALITGPYVEVQSVKIVDTISGKTPAHQNLGYDKFLILYVTVVNPEGSGYEFPVNETTLQIITGDYLWDYCFPLETLKSESVLENPLNGFIHEGETLSGELVYEVRDDMVYKYVWLCPDGNPDNTILGVYELQNIISQSAY
jgi:hypothetical protein